jgi:hypothetical protein
VAGLRAVGGDLRIEESRLAAADDGVRYWVIPSRDGQSVFFCGMDEQGDGGGGEVPFEALERLAASVVTSIHRGRWRYVVLVADGYDRARIGAIEASVTDNLAIVDAPDRERLVELVGPAGGRMIDLGPSDWDEFMAGGGA